MSDRDYAIGRGRTFRDFMESALYASGEGFYARRLPKEDFYTAPELHPAFARVLARDIKRRLDLLSKDFPEGPLSVVELGSGDGTLAQQLIAALLEEKPEWERRLRYILIERVGEVLRESLERLAGSKIQILGFTDTSPLKKLGDGRNGAGGDGGDARGNPEEYGGEENGNARGTTTPLRGVVVSNELFDALPVHLLEKSGGIVQEVYVDAQGRAELGPLSRPELREAAAAVGPSLADGQRHAVSLDARQCLRGLCGLLEAGWILTVDYGRRLARGAASPPRSYRRHAVSSDVLSEPGRRDLTSSVDFSALIEEGERCGLRTESFGTLASFLLERGVLDFLPAGGDAASYAERLQAKTLFHPDGMGEAFKVLIQSKKAAAS